MNKDKFNKLEAAKKVWKFFLKAHPDADMDAVVDLIVQETIELFKEEFPKWTKLGWYWIYERI